MSPGAATGNPPAIAPEALFKVRLALQSRFELCCVAASGPVSWRQLRHVVEVAWSPALSPRWTLALHLCVCLSPVLP